MSAELYRAQLHNSRQAVLINRMRDAIKRLSDIADAHADIGPVADYGRAKAEVDQLRHVGQMTVHDIAAEYGPHPPRHNTDTPA